MKHSVKDIKPFSKNLAPFEDRTGKWGLVNKKGVVVIEPKFSNIIGSFDNDVFIVEELDYKDGYRTNPRYYLINSEGKRISKIYSCIQAPSDGLSVVIKRNKFTDKICYGYINSKGEEVIPPKYKHAKKYKNKKCHVTNFNNFEYDIIYDSHVVDKKEEYSFDKNVLEELKHNYKLVSQVGQFYIVSSLDDSDKSFGIVNSKGEVIFPICISEVKYLNDGMFYLVADNYSTIFDANIQNIENINPYNIINTNENELMEDFKGALLDKKDFVLVERENVDFIFDYYCLVNKDTLKIRKFHYIMKSLCDSKGFIKEYNDILKYFNLSELYRIYNINITNMDFTNSNALIDPQKVWNKDFSGVTISKENLIVDPVTGEVNYDGIITDENTIILDPNYSKSKTLVLK